jgi:hypothetical protein
MERQVLIWFKVSDLLKRQEGGPGQNEETDVDLASKSDLLKRQEGGPGQDGETSVDFVSLSMLGKSALEDKWIWLY